MTTSSFAQDRFFRSGTQFFDKGLYRDALTEFRKDANAENNRDLILMRMISNFETNNVDAAKSDISKLLAFRKKDDQLYLYIAKIYHSELNFEKAVEYYKEYLRRTTRKDPMRGFVISQIKRCASGMDLKFYDQIAFVENMGREINSVNDEIDPIQSPNYLNKYYFSSNRPMSEGGRRNSQGFKDPVYGKFFLDMYTTSLENGRWSAVEPLNDLLNTGRNERVLDFSADGSILFFLKGDGVESGTIYVDTFGIERDEIYPPKFDSPLIGEKGDVYLQFYTDSTIVFASKRAGGYGGYDLYVCYKRNTYWSPPKNLGPNINTAFDEVSPFLTKDGMNLYYSSNSLESIGGFDVFKSRYSYESGNWAKGENLNMGINSSLDDMYYRVASDGQSSYFSSNRKDGYGGFDLYRAYLKNQEIGQLAYNPILPFVANDEFMKEIVKNNRIEVRDPGSKAIITETSPEKVREYVLEPLFYNRDENMFTLANAKIINNLVDIMTIYPQTRLVLESHSVKESQVAYDLYFSMKRAEKIVDYLVDQGISSRRFLIRGLGSNYPIIQQERGSGTEKLANKLNRRIELRLTETEDLPLEITYADPVVADYLKDRSAELYKTVQKGLTYKVFVARVSQMYQNDILNYYQDAMIEKGFGMDDYVYTIGLYTSYYDAQDVLKSLKEDGIEEAKIIPFIDGKRMEKAKLLEFANEYPDLVNYLQYNGQ
ncbi:OmpA family protein [Portibacter marinus]|uniref:OmpA family protein n=1 Tax=Portibacter marinus TaxID=2898660 RepID=UPI001F240C63|nr:OmpA family protein [Portibacter marinus]